MYPLLLNLQTTEAFDDHSIRPTPRRYLSRPEKGRVTYRKNANDVPCLSILIICAVVAAKVGSEQSFNRKSCILDVLDECDSEFQFCQCDSISMDVTCRADRRGELVFSMASAFSRDD